MGVMSNQLILGLACAFVASKWFHRGHRYIEIPSLMTNAPAYYHNIQFLGAYIDDVPAAFWNTLNQLKNSNSCLVTVCVPKSEFSLFSRAIKAYVADVPGITVERGETLSIKGHYQDRDDIFPADEFAEPKFNDGALKMKRKVQLD